MDTSKPRALADGYELVETPPNLNEYLALRAESGLTPMTPEQGGPALSNSWFFCHVRHIESGKAAGMGRVIGDGGWYFCIADMAVFPEHQRRGLGDVILSRLLKQIRELAPPKAYVTLMADPPGRKLYSRHGFAESMPRSLGMTMVLN